MRRLSPMVQAATTRPAAAAVLCQETVSAGQQNGQPAPLAGESGESRLLVWTRTGGASAGVAGGTSEVLAALN